MDPNRDSPPPPPPPESPRAADGPDPLLIFVAGDRSGVGKSSVCLGILGGLLSLGYAASELAYIKPATQCEDVQLVSKFCEKRGIDHSPQSPIRFYQGFTSECIAEQDPEAGARDRLDKIKTAVANIAKGKRIVLVDGVGYAAVGSVVGISNAQVAAALGSPVVVVGRPGVGDAIDSLNFAIAYFERHGASVVGAIFNNIPAQVSYHSFDECRAQVTQYLARFLPRVAPLGFIPRHEAVWQDAQARKPAEACIFRIRKGDPELSMSAEDEAQCTAILEWMAKHLDVEGLVRAAKQAPAEPSRSALSPSPSALSVPASPGRSPREQKAQLLSPLSIPGVKGRSATVTDYLSPRLVGYGSSEDPSASPRRSNSVAESPAQAISSALKRLAVAVEGGLTEGQIFHEWRVDHNSNNRTRAEVSELIGSLIAKYPDLIKNSLSVAMRKLQTSGADSQRVEAIQRGLKTDLAPLWDAIEKGHQSASSADKKALCEEVLNLVSKPDSKTLTLSSFTAAFGELGGPRIAKRFLPEALQGALAAAANRWATE